jgi:hypothetical protein
MAENTSTCNPHTERETLLFTYTCDRHVVLTVAERGAGSGKMVEIGAGKAFCAFDYA